MNEGVVIKTNRNQRYASSLVSSLLIREIGKAIGQDIQEIVVRNDCACGSTIGPIISSLTGIRAVDIGTPQLSMHSIREMGGAKDISSAIDLLEAFFSRFRQIDDMIEGTRDA